MLKIKNRQWIISEEHENTYPVHLADFVNERAREIKKISGVYLNSGYIYHDSKVVTLFEKKSFDKNKKIIFQSLLKSTKTFSNRYKKSLKFIKKWGILSKQVNSAIDGKNIKQLLSVFPKWYDIYIKVILAGQPLNIIEFEDPILTNYFIKYLDKKRSKKSNHTSYELFIKLTEPKKSNIEVKLDVKHSRIIDLIKQGMYTKNERNAIYFKSKAIINKFLKVASKEISVNKELIKYFPCSDIIKSLRVGRNNLITQSDSAGLLIINGNRYTVPKSENFTKFKKQSRNVKKTVMLKGQPAMTGKHVGTVVIVNKVLDMKKVKNNDVVVSHATSPNLVPALKTSGAIVSEMGGITSHAAIISRELKKPCIIGIKHATQVLKDGDKVEVNADKGTVKKL